MADDGKSEYQVGYAKPPQETRFKSGQSGNAKGRPKGAKNFATIFEEELEARIPVTENGKRKKITKRRAAVKQIVNKAVSGDVKAIGTVFNEARLHETQSGERPASEALSTEDLRVTASFLERIRRNLKQELIETGQEVHNRAPADDTRESDSTDPE